MDMSRRGFLVGAGAAAVSPMVGEGWAGNKVLMAKEGPRQPVDLDGHKVWELVRPHVLGWMSLDEMATGLPGPWQEFLASWWVEGPKVFMPILDETSLEKPVGLFGAKLKSGYEMRLDMKCWQPFYDKWNREVALPLYGQEIHTANLGVAILTNIHLFRLALKYTAFRCKEPHFDERTQTWSRPGA